MGSLADSGLDLRHELRGIYAIWLRELKVFRREKSRIVSSLITPMLWLFVVGGGIGATVGEIETGDCEPVEAGTNGTADGTASDPCITVDYQSYIYPGILAMSVTFTSVFFGMYIVWDRKVDFLKEVLAAPMTRTSVFLGKMLGGSTDALIQVTLLLLFAAYFEMELTVLSLVGTVLFLFLLALCMTAVGLAIGSQMESPEGFSLIVSFVVFPMFFLSGAIYKLDGLPPWLGVATRFDPVTYAVDGLRNMLLPDMAFFNVAVDLAVLLGFCVGMIAVGTFGFKRMRL